MSVLKEKAKVIMLPTNDYTNIYKHTNELHISKTKDDQQLANQKVENKSWLWRNYIDDRVEYLEPIKINRYKKQTE